MSRVLRLFFCSIVFVASTARADDSHYQDFVVGDRAIGMGGAFCAIADDPSGVYYNPAGLADVRQSNVQVSASLYGFERGEIADRITVPVPGVEELDVQFTDLIIVPASAGFVKSFGKKDETGYPYQAYSLSVIVPSFRSFRAGDVGSSYNRRVTDRELWTGIGYGRRITARLRLGVSAYYVLRSVVDTEDVSVAAELDDGSQQFQTVRNDISFTNGAVLAILGAKLSLSEHLTLGAALQSPSLPVHSQVDLRFTRAVSDPSSAQSRLESIVVSNTKSETAYAPSLRVGAAYSRKYRYTLAVDARIHAPVSYTLVEVDDATASRLPFNPDIERRTVVNFNAGGEYLLVREVSLAGGFFTDFSSAPTIKAQPTRDQPPRVNLYGFVLALGYFGEHTLSRLGVQYSFGRGHDVIPEGSDIERALTAQQAFKKVDYFQSFFYIFLSSTFRY